MTQQDSRHPEQVASGLIGGFPTVADRKQWERQQERAAQAGPLAADRFDVKRSGAQVTLVCLRCSRRVDSWPAAGLDTITGAATAHQLAQHAESDGVL